MPSASIIALLAEGEATYEQRISDLKAELADQEELIEEYKLKVARTNTALANAKKENTQLSAHLAELSKQLNANAAEKRTANTELLLAAVEKDRQEIRELNDKLRTSGREIEKLYAQLDEMSVNDDLREELQMKDDAIEKARVMLQSVGAATTALKGELKIVVDARDALEQRIADLEAENRELKELQKQPTLVDITSDTRSESRASSVSRAPTAIVNLPQTQSLEGLKHNTTTALVPGTQTMVTQKSAPSAQAIGGAMKGAAVPSVVHPASATHPDGPTSVAVSITSSGHRSKTSVSTVRSENTRPASKVSVKSSKVAPKGPMTFFERQKLKNGLAVSVDSTSDQRTPSEQESFDKLRHEYRMARLFAGQLSDPVKTTTTTSPPTAVKPHPGDATPPVALKEVPASAVGQWDHSTATNKRTITTGPRQTADIVTSKAKTQQQNAPTTNTTNIPEVNTKTQAMMTKKDKEIEFLTAQLRDLRMSEPTRRPAIGSSEKYKRSYNEALRSAYLDFKSCNNCYVHFYGAFRGGPDDGSDFLALRCTHCDSENMRWNL